MKIGILNLEINNIKSIYSALSNLGETYLINDINQYKSNTSLIVLPGNGKFEEGMKSLKLKKFDTLIKDSFLNNKKILGICLGMQLMMSDSEESPGCEGLNLIHGSVKLVSSKIVKVPLLGWYDVKFKDCNFNDNTFFFNNKYMVAPKDKNAILGYVGNYLPAFINKKNIYSLQFHPEKSSEQGMNILELILKV
ncbi:imidazole glycerol phosphate synthase subunit HisH [Candidatus Pelagibacter sp. Uisw_121]|uniref:imidazole glycerol phosphate synthase subunit HisH n=1 Tax=Candidatus Pelagibacter sp. Uisw_121 TaxID=3230987 RepID=UPI0039E72D08